MEIYGSTIWVNPEETKEWYQLQVISQWDWDSKAICFKQIGNDIISYKLCHHIADAEKQPYLSCNTVDIITDEMKEELINQGYTISNKV
jgi:hypothetical protein